MYRRFDTLSDAYAHLNATWENRRLWTILTFDDHAPFYTFTSTASPGGQMYNIGRNILEMSGHYGPGQAHGRELARHFSDVLQARDAGRGLIHPGRHAEEWMLDHFAEILASATAGNGGNPPATGQILNSDTPCSLLDADPSANLTGWPVSCTRKLARLAQNNPQIAFTVSYMRRYGAQGGHSAQQIATYFNNAVAGAGGAGQIAIAPYTNQQVAAAQPFLPL